MNRNRLLWLMVAVALAMVVAYQVNVSSDHRMAEFTAQADMPTVAPGIDVLAGWTDDNPAPGGHDGCDTRNDILDRDLIDKTYTSIKRCPNAVAAGTLHDPYTNATVAFVRGNQVGASVQIDHIVSAAVTPGAAIAAAQHLKDMPLTDLDAQP